jgi:hypothetical protein
MYTQNYNYATNGQNRIKQIPIHPIAIVADQGQILSILVNTGTQKIYIEYEVWETGAEMNRTVNGGTGGRVRTIFTNTLQVTSVGAGETSDIKLITPYNPAGTPLFPWTEACPQQRKYHIRAIGCDSTATVGTNLAINGIRLNHEGRELITPAGVVQSPNYIYDVGGTTTRMIILPRPWTVEAGEQLSMYLQVLSTDGGAQDATLMAWILMDEEILGEVKA